jgi:alkanesulfonate monooxygenase SsuD/methylene tetrahydromethanopterin reductase-like flavin-dependent oxidoreductase (luciferase family)
VEGRFLRAGDTAGLRAEATRADAEGAAAVFLSESALGDPIVLAAGLAPLVPRVLLGARMEWSREGRHPALLARDITSLDLVCGGRSVLCFAPPFTEPLAEAISLCRALWLAGETLHEGPYFPLQAAAGRARPAGERIPQIALDLTAGDGVPSFLVGAADLLLWPLAEAPAACLLECV